MKKFICTLLVITMMLAFAIPAMAASVGVSTTSLTIEKGKTATFSISASDAQAWAIVSSANPSIASVNVTEPVWVENSSSTVTITGKSVGATTITVVFPDAASADGEVDLSGASRTITVNVVEPTTKPVQTTAPTTAKPTTKPTTTKPTTTASTAADLKSLSVDGYSISPKFSAGRTSYNMEVPADFAGKLNVKAVPLDSAAKVTITGNDITDGKGTIKITVKGTDGTTKTYRITVAPPAETTTEAPTVAEGLKLSTLKVGADLALDFQPDVLEYTVKVPAGTKSLDVEALIGEIEGATVRVEGADDLAASNNVVKVIVTDADGVETVYTINVAEETPLATTAPTQDDEKKSGMPIWLAIMLILLAFILGLVIGFLLGKKKAEDDYYDDDDDDPIFGGSADDDAPVSLPYSDGMSFNPPSVGGAPLNADFSLPYEAAAPIAQDTAPATTPIASADSFIQSAD